MTEEMNEAKFCEDHEEGEILEDGEIADDEDDVVVPVSSQMPTQSSAFTKDEKENKESNKTKFGSFNSYFQMERDDHFKTGKRKKKGNSKKRKRSNSNESKKKFREQCNDSLVSRESVDVTQYLYDSSFDNIELADQDEFNFDLLDFDVLMEILGCTVNKSSLASTLPNEKVTLMTRIVKIMKKLHGNDPDTARRFARLKRRTRERQNSVNGSQSNNSGTNATKPVFKAACKFYLEGKCHKGSDCYFSHDCPIPKRKELCKFYLQGFCGKGDGCLFMHGEFPCKFFHTNTECYSGEKCRFSHAPLTEDTREILRNYLDSGTLPDDPKPFRPSHHSAEWQNSNTKNEGDSNDAECAEFDSSFNYETEQLLSKPRPVILGPPTRKMKTCYETWKWQQEMKELEKAYTGLKKNLFCIDEMFAILEKPPSPRIEDDEEEIEAQIQNYYNDILDTDEYDEMLALQEIEEHQKKVQEEEGKDLLQTPKECLPDKIIDQEELSDEEEKRLIKASAHDEDLRIIPGALMVPGAPFQNPPVLPPAMNIPPAFEPLNYNASSYFGAHDNYTPHFNSDNPPKVLDTNSEIGAPFSKPHDITVSDVNNLVNQIRNNIVPEPNQTVAPVTTLPSKPEYRDPRLKRLKDSNRSSSSSTINNSNTATVEEKTTKPFIKICNPNVLIEYKLVLINVSKINYSCYSEYYQNDNSLKNDPRLKKYFTSNQVMEPSENKSTPEVDCIFSKTENLMTLPSLNIPTIKKVPTIVVKPPLPSKILSPLELISSKPNPESENTNNIKRDPRMRCKDVDHRQNSESNISETLSDGKTSESLVLEKTDINKVSNNLEVKDISESTNSDNTPLGTSSADQTKDLSSIPSYAIAALPSTRSLFSSVTTNRLYPTCASVENNSAAPSLSTTSLLHSNSFESSHSSIENNDRNDGVDDQLNGFKLDSSITNSDPLMPNKNAINAELLNIWHSNINNTVDSDNEMEIDLQHHNESEVESENENELIIVSTSEAEDNKECNSQSNDPLTINNYSINC